MCKTCGCDDHRSSLMAPRKIRLEKSLLDKNDEIAARNRAFFRDRGIRAVNLIGSPGAGKTLLLEKTISRISRDLTVAVLEGDQETDQDAIRIRKTGVAVVQINTGAGCHLDARMVESALDSLGLARVERSLLFIENVGNLVCPALFDLGEEAKVVVMSVTEGEDKPLKYPHIFRAASVLVLTKTDLLPHLDFDLEVFLGHVHTVNPSLVAFQVSAAKGDGLDAWCRWLVRTDARPETARMEDARLGEAP